MNLLFEPVTIVLICNLLLGVLVLQTNWRRPVNVSFFLMAAVQACWLATRHLAFLSVADRWQALFWIRTCSIFGVLVPLAGALLRAAILEQGKSWRQLLLHIRMWLAAAALVTAICLSPFYLKDVLLPDHPALSQSRASIPKAIYGWGYPVLSSYLISSVLLLTSLIFRDLRRGRLKGVRSIELQYMQLGYVALLAGTIITFGTNPRYYGFFGTLAYVTIIAYGITTRSILDVRTFMRRVLSYCVLFAYACSVFWVVWMLSRWALVQSGVAPASAEFWPPLIGAFAVAVLVTPSRTGFQRLARRIAPPRDLDFEATVTRIEGVIQTFTSRRTLLDGFCRVLREEANTDGVRVALGDEKGGFRQIYPPPLEDRGLTLLPDDPILKALRRPGMKEVTLEHLERRVSDPGRDAQLARLRELKSDAVVPIRRRGELVGLMLMGQRHGGRIFGRTGLAVLRVLADQLAVALENCRLYSEAKRTAAYVQTLVENLTVGVIAADRAHGITVFNREAERLLALSRDAARRASDLPVPAAGLLSLTLAETVSTRDEPLTLNADTPQQIDLLASSLPFTFDEDDLLGRPSVGAILVLTDRTALLRLERQVHQSERLASIGTLAAGTAHEIKNPLVSLRVFTQLLPKRFDDPEFRNTFHELVSGEIARIENIVNQMLDFARPSKPALASVRLHDIIQAVLRLVTPQAEKNGITVRADLAAADDSLTGDRAKLQQVLLNLLINAIEAFSDAAPDRRVEVSTRLERGFPGDPNDSHAPPVLVTDVRDNGPGVPTAMLPHLFDPFFTTKANGTGLGLSVSHTIVRDHGGFLEVFSEPGRGTRFSIRLPVAFNTLEVAPEDAKEDSEVHVSARQAGPSKSNRVEPGVGAPALLP